VEAALAGRRVFPLVPRPRLVGLPFGEHRSARRGPGTDVVGGRPYTPGDPVSTIDWHASARLSAALDRDEFVVRSHQADEAPRVVVVCDRRPAMGVYRAPVPWLSKPAALHAATQAIVASAGAARGDVGSIDHAGAGSAGDAYWLPPGGRGDRWLIDRRQSPETGFDAPGDTVERALAYLGRMRSALPSGTFLFVLSDFLAPPPVSAWLEAGARRWDVVPVVIQDPVWEQSFPDVGTVVLPVADPAGGGTRLVRLTAREARSRRAENEARLARLRGELESLGFDPLVLGSDRPEEIDEAFLRWADFREAARWRR
jgi:uncharacterized protein (DUF58 family)